MGWRVSWHIIWVNCEDYFKKKWWTSIYCYWWILLKRWVKREPYYDEIGWRRRGE